MSVTKYQIYLKTVELGSFTAAARALNFTQSGVSHAIGSLEEELGVTLLVRSHGGVTPPADGLTANAIPKGQEVLIVIGEGLEKERIEVRLKG